MSERLYKKYACIIFCTDANEHRAKARERRIVDSERAQRSGRTVGIENFTSLPEQAEVQGEGLANWLREGYYETHFICSI